MQCTLHRQKGRKTGGSPEGLKEIDDLIAANRYFEARCEAIPGFKKLANNVYQYDDIWVNVGKIFSMYRQYRGLQTCLKAFPKPGKEAECVPYLLCYVDLENDKDCVLITRVKGSDVTPPEPYRSARDTVSLQARQRAFEEAEYLCRESGVYFPGMLNKDSWAYVASTDTIVFCDLTEVQRAMRGNDMLDAAKKFLEELKDRLDLEE